MPTGPALSSASSDVIAALRSAVRHDPGLATRSGLLAMRASREEEAIPLLREAARHHPRDPRLWQTLGLSLRNVGDLAGAVGALDRARTLVPLDALIAHGAARARMEAGLDAVEDFVRARRLAPADGEVIQGHAAALLATGNLAAAIIEIAVVVARQPLWLEGQRTLARLRHMAGDPDDLRGYRDGVRSQPRSLPLWSAWLSTLALAERFEAVPAALAQARRSGVSDAGFDLFTAISADDTGDHDRAGAYFDRLPDIVPVSTAVWQVRSLIRRERFAEAATRAETFVRSEGGHILWPYLSLAWRLNADPRSEWLDGDPAFVQVHDIADAVGDLSALAGRLRSLHVAKEQPLDQSVRHGTQTDGPLLSRIDPEIMALQTAIRNAIGRYVDGLPPRDTSHPLLGARRAPIRIAGSWSVRLAQGGYHADHVHPHGWISSAFYVALPDTGEEKAGWLTLGSSNRLLPTLAPLRMIEPKPGRLVLFPSTMWHGTRPFAVGERLTVAFDVARVVE